MQVPSGPGLQEEYLGRIVGPLTIHKELILMLSFRQIQDGHKVILAAERKEAVFQVGGGGWVGADLWLQVQPRVRLQESRRV